MKKHNKSPIKKEERFVITNDYKQNIRNNSYLGKKGYTIPKNALHEKDYETLKKELFVKPIIFNMNYGGKDAAETQSFPVYRESGKKIYIPRFYGIDRYGLPKDEKLQTGDDICLHFDKKLRDYQENIVGIYMNYVNSTLTENSTTKGNGGILEVPCGRGKTIMALNIISKLQKKTLIIVHKEFLMNQWIERINEFLPGAKIGKIQGPEFNIENKDIVIGMIQTIYDKIYDDDAFSSFGLTIIDEVHRIGSEQFSRTLFKTITPYMLGISATVERKDKLTKILYMFIGKKIYEEKREDDEEVQVRSLFYNVQDQDFNDTLLDYRGNPKFSSMITKLSNYNRRSDFIMKVLTDLRKENNKKQVMILAHNRSLLTYFYEYITYHDIGTTGYYVGGMKQEKLQETETKDIVLATYAMAAEALDIKTLSTLIMASPKTDITQSVGRILRTKHQNPIIIDIVDPHDIFQKQWLQRKRFYKKCNYKIFEINSNKYEGMKMDTWKITYTPKVSNINEKETEEQEEPEEAPKKCMLDASVFD